MMFKKSVMYQLLKLNIERIKLNYEKWMNIRLEQVIYLFSDIF